VLSFKLLFQVEFESKGSDPQKKRKIEIELLETERNYGKQLDIIDEVIYLNFFLFFLFFFFDFIFFKTNLHIIRNIIKCYY